MPTDHELFLLRTIVSAVGDLSTKDTHGVDRGFLMSLSMTLDALLVPSTDKTIFSQIRIKFDGLPSEGRTGVLYLALLSVCDLAVDFSLQKAEELGTSLLSSATVLN